MMPLPPYFTARAVMVVLVLALASPLFAVVWQGAQALFGAADTITAHHSPIGKAAANTLLLTILAALGAASMGVVSAWLVGFYDFYGRHIVRWALLLPLAIPPYITAMAYGEVLDYAGPVQTGIRTVTGNPANLWSIRSLWGAAFVFAVSLFPYPYLFARAVFANQSKRLLEVAELAGLTPWRTFCQVVVPMAAPAIMVAMLLVAMEVLSDYGVVSYYGVLTLSTLLFRTWFGAGDFAVAALIAFAMFAVVMVVLIGDQWFRRKVRYYQTNRSAATETLPCARYPRLALFLTSLPIMLGFGVPVMVLGAWLVDANTGGAFWQARWYARTGAMLADTLWLCASAAALIVMVALIIVYAKRLARPNAALSALTALATSGYAMPGLVIAIGVMMVMSGLTDAVNAAFGIDAWLGGGMVALWFGLLVRFLTSAFNVLEAGMQQISPNMEESARLMGAGTLTIMAKVHRPLLAPSVLVALCLVVMEVAKELPMVMALRPFSMSPLSMGIWQMASDERVRDAAPYALALIAMLMMCGAVFYRLVKARGMTHLL